MSVQYYEQSFHQMNMPTLHSSASKSPRECERMSRLMQATKSFLPAAPLLLQSRFRESTFWQLWEQIIAQHYKQKLQSLLWERRCSDFGPSNFLLQCCCWFYGTATIFSWWKHSEPVLCWAAVLRWWKKPVESLIITKNMHFRFGQLQWKHGNPQKCFGWKQ